MDINEARKTAAEWAEEAAWLKSIGKPCAYSRNEALRIMHTHGIECLGAGMDCPCDRDHT